MTGLRVIPQTKKQGWWISFSSLFSAVAVKVCIIIKKKQTNKKTETLDSDLCKLTLFIKGLKWLVTVRYWKKLFQAIFYK